MRPEFKPGKFDIPYKITGGLLYFFCFFFLFLVFGVRSRERVFFLNLVFYSLEEDYVVLCLNSSKISASPM